MRQLKPSVRQNIFYLAAVDTMTKDCPNCGLVNSPNAQRCDCGYQFDKQANDSGLKPTAFETNEFEKILKVSSATIIIGFILTALIMLFVDGVIIKIEYPYFWTKVLHYLLEPGVIAGSEYVSKKSLKMVLNSVDKRFLRDHLFIGRLYKIELGLRIVLFLIVMMFLDYNLGITVDDSIGVHCVGYLFLVYSVRHFLGLLARVLKQN